MVTNLAEAQSVKAEIHERILRKIISLKIPPLIPMWKHLDREIIIGLIGERGGGKSGTAAAIAITNFLVKGIPVYSNMPIRIKPTISDGEAQKYGLNKGGGVLYESQPLDAEALVMFDDMFKDSCIVADEINKVLSNSRRFMSNTNLWFNNVSEQLRKLHASLIYTVINEMSVDSQLRSLTDLFIRCEDTAITPEGLAHKKEPGMNFKLTLYPMSRIINGQSYYQTHKALPPVYFQFGRFRGVYNDKLAQAAGKLKYGLDINMNKIKWAWLGDAVEKIKQDMKKRGDTQIYDYELWRDLGLAGRGIAPRDIGQHLPVYGLYKSHRESVNSHQVWVYELVD